MGRYTVQFSCHQCVHCCTNLVVLPTPQDVINITKATGLPPRQFLEFLAPEEIDEVAASDPTWLRCNGRRYIMALKRDTRRGCHFLDKRKKMCKIYEHRPILCQLFPYKLQETRNGEFRGFTLHKDTGCPLHRDDVAETAPLYEAYLEDQEHQDDYQELVRVFNQKRYADKRPEDFLAMFVTEK